MLFKILLCPEDDGAYSAFVPAMTYGEYATATCGDDLEQTIEMAREAIILMAEDMIDEGKLDFEAMKQANDQVDRPEYADCTETVYLDMQLTDNDEFEDLVQRSCKDNPDLPEAFIREALLAEYDMDQTNLQHWTMRSESAPNVEVKVKESFTMYRFADSKGERVRLRMSRVGDKLISAHCGGVSLNAYPEQFEIVSNALFFADRTGPKGVFNVGTWFSVTEDVFNELKQLPELKQFVDAGIENNKGKLLRPDDSELH